MLQDELFKQKEDLIQKLETDLNRYQILDKTIDETMILIEDELDTNGKKKFSNDLKRKDELSRRIPQVVKEYNDLKISLEITRLKISNFKQKIDFVNLKVS